MIVRLCDPVHHPDGVLRAVTLRRANAEDAERILALRGHLDTTTEGNWRLLAAAAAVLCDLPIQVVAKMSATDIQRIGDLIGAGRGTTKEKDHDETIDLLPRQIN